MHRWFIWGEVPSEVTGGRIGMGREQVEHSVGCGLGRMARGEISLGVKEQGLAG